MTLRTGLAIAAATLSLGACGGMEMTGTPDQPMRTAAGTAETACMTAVSANMAGGSATVINSEPAAAGARVMLRSSGGTNWRCLASDNGVVEDLSIV